MAKGADEVKVGLFVLIAGAVLLLTLVAVGGGQFWRQSGATYQVRLRFAGGVEPGTIVRFAGIKAGRVTDVQMDPADSSQVLVGLQLRPDTPIKVDSTAAIQTLGFLGDNYVEISPGSKAAEPLPPGNVIPAKETVQLAEVFERVDMIARDSQVLMTNLNEKINSISGRAELLLGNVNSVFNESNKRELAALLRNGNGMINRADGMLARTEPKLEATLSNVQATSEKFAPLLDDFKGTVARLDGLILNMNDTVGELRPELKRDLTTLHTTLTEAQTLIRQLDDGVRQNRGDLDEIITNFARSSRHIEDLTNTLKQRPYSVLGLRPVKERKVPGGK